MEESPDQMEYEEELEQENAQFRDHDQMDQDEEDQMGESYMEQENSMGIYRHSPGDQEPDHDQYQPSEHSEHSEQYQHSQQQDITHSQLESPRRRHMDEGSEGSDDLNASFQRDIDTITHIKATIMYNINLEREKAGSGEIYEDITLSAIASQFAISLKGREMDRGYLERLNSMERNDIRMENMKPLYVISGYEEDTQITKQVTFEYFIEMGHLFFEMDQERRTLLDPLNNHIGIGLAGNEVNVVIVLFVISRDLCITSIVDKGESVEVRGKMLDYNVGINGVKIYNSESFEKKKEKDKFQPDPIYIALQDKMEYSKITKEFIIHLDFHPSWKQKRWIELFTRQNPDGITYKKPLRKDGAKDKNDFKHFKMKLRALFVPYPDSLYETYYHQLKENNFQKNKDMMEEMVRKEEEEKLRLEQAEMEMYQQHKYSDNEEKESGSDRSDSDEDSNQKMTDRNREAGGEGAASNKEIREELQLAIIEAKKTYEILLIHNRELQEQIKELKNKHEGYTEKGTGDMTMNEHKYLNTLTQVHQTRVDLQTTQDRYNRMSLELQNKLTQKQNRCNEIRAAFQDLKREVTKKAAYTRSDQPIKPNRITEWEDQEKRQAEELQNLRLQILRARNTLAKNQKILKKKQQLADGLHLIDFQQLKIQNQTLNQKIQQNNQKLHKLKKQTTTKVQTLTHTRQKLGFVRALKQKLQSQSQSLQQQITQVRKEIGSKKGACEILKDEIQKVKQQTEIVNSQELVIDYKKRNSNISQLEQEIEDLQMKERDMKEVIKNYQNKIKRDALR